MQLMKIAIVGLGSIGKRHLHNIVHVMEERNIPYQIDAVRSSHRNLEVDIRKEIANEYYEYERMPNDYDIIFVTNPTAFHYETIKSCVNKTKHMFIEKPVFMKPIENIENIHLRKNGVYYVAGPLKHKKVIQYVKNEICDAEVIYSVRAISSSYLPKWRKGIDYRNSYSAKSKLGGGVELDLIHEWDYLAYMFGRPEMVKRISAHVSKLEINSNDIATYIAKYPTMIVEVHLDYFGINAERILEIICEKKRIVVDLIRNDIKVWTENAEQRIHFEDSDFYLTEMNYFVDLILGKQKNINSIQEANELLKKII